MNHPSIAGPNSCPKCHQHLPVKLAKGGLSPGHHYIGVCALNLTRHGAQPYDVISAMVANTSTLSPKLLVMLLGGPPFWNWHQRRQTAELNARQITVRRPPIFFVLAICAKRHDIPDVLNVLACQTKCPAEKLDNAWWQKEWWTIAIR